MADYKIGFWNYMKMDRHNDGTVSEWEGLGYNYAMTPFYEEEKKDKFLSILSQCDEKGIDVVVKDQRSLWKRLASKGEDEFRKGVKEMKKQFGKHKCVHSFFIGDEPHENDMEIVAKACKIVKQECGGIKAFLSVATPVAMERNKLKDTLIKLIKDGELDYLVYNCYSQGMANIEQRQQGINSYFEFLNMFREIRAVTQVPIWISLLGIGHWFYRAPSQSDMRWQLNTAAAYGIEGFVWFHPYESFNPHFGGQGYQINLFGEKTQSYQWMSEEDKKFMLYIAQTLKDATLEKVYQHWQNWIPMGGTQMFEKDIDEVVSDVVDIYNRPLIISRFKKKDGSPIVAVCNASQTDIAEVTATFKAPYEDKRRHFFLTQGGIYLFDLGL